MNAEAWYKAHNCTHAHCPFDCEHPQPFLLDDNILYCGHCWFVDTEMTKMIPCSPEVCGD